MHDLIVHNQLTTLIAQHQDPNAATAIIKSIRDTTPQVALVQHRQCLLHVPGIRHGDNAPIITNIQHAVLLEHRAKHVLHNHRRGRVADEAAFLVQLLGEQVDAEVAVLARLRRRRDADYLARAALQDQQVADADVVAWDRDGCVVRHAVCAVRMPAFVTLVVHGLVARGVVVVVRVAAGRNLDVTFLDDDLLALDVLAVPVVMVMAEQGRSVNRMSDPFSDAFESSTKGVVLALAVVIAHITLVVMGGRVDGGARRAFFDANFGLAGGGKVGGGTSEVAVSFDGASVLAELTFGDV